MTTIGPIDFCPAAACAAAIERFEAFIDHVAALIADVRLARSPDLIQKLETISDELMLAADDARDRLSKVEAVSSAGAMAQLLAAIRDIRVRDDHERDRAKDLEASAIRFLGLAQLFDPGFCSKLSQTTLGPRLHAPGQASAQRIS